MNDTVDAMMRGRFSIVQSAKGHRAGLDAMLLQAVVPHHAEGHLVDLGAGCGTVAFAALTRAPALTATLVEAADEECERAERALRLPENAHLVERVEIVCAEAETFRPIEPCDWVLANPPYNDARHQPPEGDARRRARTGDVAMLRAWQATAHALLRPKGTAAFILRPEWWPQATFGRGFGNERLLPVRSCEGEEASRIIAMAGKQRRSPASILPDLIVHRSDGGFRPDVAAILDGAAGLFDAGA